MTPPPPLHPPDPTSATDADLFGLPQQPARPQTTARDPVESLATEYLDALRLGKQPSIEHYAALYPQSADAIRELFPLIAALEDWKSDRELSTARGSLPEQFDILQLGDCRILREIGRGGMGVVFEAEQAPTGRRVAVKLLPWRFASGSRWRERFHQEARTAAQLRHPHIVPVFSYGEHEGMAYYVMQLVEGIGLNRIIERLAKGEEVVTTQDLRQEFTKGRPIDRDAAAGGLVRSQRVLSRESWPQMARIAWQTADALRYAHRQGTLHRDIKPANLLIDGRGAVAVADFGLARPLEEDLSSGTPRLAGTLRYMAPEQFEGRADERTDLYALGASLYEMCTLRPAYLATNKGDLVQQISAGEPERPRQVRPEVPRRLEAIILRAMQRNPGRRYQSAEQLMGDLRDFLKRGRWGMFRWFR